MVIDNKQRLMLRNRCKKLAEWRNLILGGGMARKYLRTLAAAAVAMASTGHMIGQAQAQTGVDNPADGQLGVDGILYEGQLYDVSIEQGTCKTVFAPCDSSTDFTFSDGFAALGAADTLGNAIVGLVAADPGSGFASAITNLTDLLTPFAVSSGIVVHTEDAQTGDAWSSADVASVFSLSNSIVDYAVWTAVPEPASASLLAAGIAGVAAVSRRRKKKT
jgi:hypothetical protein